MREIKFRAWVGEMVQVEMIDWKGGTNLADPGIMDHHNDIYYFHDYPDMLMQFTGLHDKNGKEIFEGDIVSGGSEHNIRILVIWVSSGAGFSFETKGKGLMGMAGIHTSIEIIGNIHENPELLK